MKAFLFLLALSAPVLAAGDNWVAEEVFGGAANVAILTGASRVEACTLRYIRPTNGKDFGPGERYEENRSIEVPKESVERLLKILLADSTYLRNVRVGCWPQFHTRVKFHRAEKVVAIDFCFSCELLIVARGGKVVGDGLFHDDGALLAEMRLLFPKDAALAKAR